MPHMYFHLRACNEFHRDDEGCEVCNIAEAQEHILEVVRELGEDVDPRWSFEVVDVDGELVMTVPFSKVLADLH